MKIPVPTPEPQPAAPAEKPEVPHPPKRAGAAAWIAAIILVAAGGAGAWYWLTQVRGKQQPKQTVEVPATKPVVEKTEQSPDAGRPEAEGSEQPRKKEEAAKQPGAKKAASAAQTTARKGARKKSAAKVTARKKRLAKKKAVELVKQGNALVKAGKYGKAISAYRKALKLDPKMALAHRGLGVAYAYLKKNKLACREYRKYYKMLPANSPERKQLEQILKTCRR